MQVFFGNAHCITLTETSVAIIQISFKILHPIIELSLSQEDFLIIFKTTIDSPDSHMYNQNNKEELQTKQTTTSKSWQNWHR